MVARYVSADFAASKNLTRRECGDCHSDGTFTCSPAQQIACGWSDIGEGDQLVVDVEAGTIVLEQETRH